MPLCTINYITLKTLRDSGEKAVKELKPHDTHSKGDTEIAWGPSATKPLWPQIGGTLFSLGLRTEILDHLTFFLHEQFLSTGNSWEKSGFKFESHLRNCRVYSFLPNN